ncbi:hypothetical protein [Brachybacterium epidermidis]|uniref:hypothetical protein n=1 Tax=Brachybacterium epidermidis TaxID=2781983 RepID=UPI00398F80EA
MTMLHNTAAHARTQLSRINSALENAGLDTIPAPDTTTVPTITAPTATEVAEAVLAAKDPSTDKKVQALATRAWLAQNSGVKNLADERWMAAWDRFRTEQGPALLETIRDRYREAGEHLSAAATGPLREYGSLAQLDLGSLPTALAHEAAETISHYRHAVALHQAWVSVCAGLAGQGRKSHWAEQGNPTLEQYRAAANSAPQTFPKNDAWSIVRKGWQLELAESFVHVGERRNALREQDQAIDEGARKKDITKSLAGGGFIVGPNSNR